MSTMDYQSGKSQHSLLVGPHHINIFLLFSLLPTSDETFEFGNKVVSDSKWVEQTIAVI